MLMIVDSFERVFGRSHFINVMALVFLTSALYLPGLWSIPPIDRDEARFAQATRQMVEDGDYFHIQFQDEARHKKPPGIYHLQAVVVGAVQWLSGDDSVVDSIVWYRLPSFAGALLTVLLTYGFAVYYFNDKAVSLFSAGLLASSVLLIVEAHQATTDAVLCAAMTGVMGAMGVLYLWRGEAGKNHGDQGGRGAVVLFWLLLALGFYVKGPIAVLIPLVCLVSLSVWDRDWRLIGMIRPVRGLILFSILTACWAVPLHVATGGSFWRDAFWGDFLPKLQSGVESHSFLPGFYIVIVVITFWPGSLVAGWAVARAWKMMRSSKVEQREMKVVRFLFAWLVPMWVILELTPTRLPHYVLPLYPALAMLTAIGVCGARSIDENEQAECDGQARARNGSIVPTTGMKLGFLFWGMITLGMGGAIAFVLNYLHWPFTWKIYPVIYGLAGAAVFSVWWAWRGRLYWACVIGAVCCVVVMVFLWGMVLPNIDTLWLSRSTAAALRSETHSSALPDDVVVVGYREPSLVFLTKRDIHLMSADRAAQLCVDDHEVVVLVTRDREDVFLSSLHKRGYRVVMNRSVVTGYNYSNGKWVTMSIVRGFVKVK